MKRLEGPTRGSQRFSFYRVLVLFCFLLFLGFIPVVLAQSGSSDTPPDANAMPPDPPTPSPESENNEVRVSADEDGQTIDLQVGQELVISLEANPSTGFAWEVEEVDSSILTQTGDITFEPESDLIGAPGLATIGFEAVAEGQSPLTLVYRRPWETDIPPVKTFSITVRVGGADPEILQPDPIATPSGPDAMPATTEEAGPGGGPPVDFESCGKGGCSP
ncbi:MAG: hypothetical protein EPO21_18895 [Chloroflexota bacterium]|nr:MAG: hypothetical protein EPO21_18895 [Chloroflexota bacterium]